MSPHVRRFDEAEWRPYRALRLEALEREPHAFASALAQEADLAEADWRRRLARRDAGTFGVFLPAGPVGIATWLLPEPLNSRHRAFIVGVYLQPAHRGRGLARALLEAVIGEAERHADDLALDVWTGNDSAIALYRRLGFRTVATIPGALRHAGRHYDEHHMLRSPRFAPSGPA